MALCRHEAKRLRNYFRTGRRDVGQAFQPDISAAPVRLESLTYDF
jgi:hypothetical protein